MDISREYKTDRQYLERHADRSRLISAFGIAVLGILLPYVFWKTSLPHLALLLWGLAQTPISLSLIASIYFRRRGDYIKARHWNLLTLCLWSVSFALLPWFTTGSTSASPDKYMLYCALLAVTSVLGATATQFPFHRLERKSLLFGVTVSYAIAYAQSGEWSIMCVTFLWCLFVYTNSEVNVRSAVELKRLRKISDHAATHDSLTSLYNRHGFIIHVEKTLAQPNGQHLAIIDLDSFKLLNDAFGHQFGDHVLSEVGARLKASLPAGSLIARIGGDEFAAIIPRHRDHDLRKQLETVLTTLKQPVSYRKRSKQIGVSIGIALWRSGISASDWMAEADIAMYRGKQKPGASISFFDMAAREANVRQIELEERFRLAVAKREIVFWCQPLVRASDQHPVGVELLARWPQSDGSFISPAEFIPVAQQTLLINELGRQALECAAELLDRWASDPVLSTICVNVNISPSHLRAGLADDIKKYYPPMDKRLGIEFVETDLISGFSEEQDCLEQLAETGLRLIIDDFGVGYSSISYLCSLPVSEVKIDRSFIDGIESDSTRQKLIAAIIDMTNALDMTCVAEGIETTQALKTLQHHGVHHLQGYWIARPQPTAIAEETLRRLHRNSSHLSVNSTANNTIEFRQKENDLNGDRLLQSA